MMKFNKTAIGVDQGEDVLFSDYEDGGAMWTGSGSRERRHKLTFKEPFKSVPAVHISLSLWDMDSATNARADVAAEKRTIGNSTERCEACQLCRGGGYVRCCLFVSHPR